MSKFTKYIKSHFWARLYIRIAAVFIIFVLVLSFCDSTMLYGYYVYSEKRDMKKVSREIDKVNLYGASAREQISFIIEDKNYILNIKDSFGNMLFRSRNAPVENYKGEFLNKSQDKKGNKIISESYVLSGGEILTLSVPASLLENSANTANKFIFFIALFCLALTLIWSFIIAHKITKPLGEMNETANALARLDFSKKIKPQTFDEIGQLGASINDLSDNLYKALADLERKNSALQGEIEEEHRLYNLQKEFVGNVSHELKTPIAIISGYAEGLKIGELNETEKQEYLNVIIDESRRMNDMVLDLLNLSRMQSGQNVLSLSDYNIQEQIIEICERLRLRFPDKTIETDLYPIIVTADYVKIGEVLNNFINNAISHLSSGGKIKVSLEETERNVKILVYNDGENIPTEDLEHIWDSFWRGEASHKRDSQRVGLGLSIVRTIMELHGTSCGVNNEVGGVTFWFSVTKS